MNAERPRLLRTSTPSACDATALLIARALGRPALTGAEIPSAYAAAAIRKRSVPALPQSVLARLLPEPLIDSTAPAVIGFVMETVLVSGVALNTVRSSRVSNLRCCRADVRRRLARLKTASAVRM